MENVMNIATALNRKYLRYTTVMLVSLCENNPDCVRVFLLNHELTEQDVQMVRDILKKYGAQVEDLKVRRDMFPPELPYNEQWSIETYFRLLLQDILPDDVGRLIYLDADIIINRPLREMYELDFAGMDLMAAKDTGWSLVREKYNEKQKELINRVLETGHGYFNAGVLLMNIEKIRKKYSFQTYLDAIKRWDYQMYAFDQDILNDVHATKAGYFDAEVYNLGARVAHNQNKTYADMKDTAIIHYTGFKPWDSGNCHYDIEKLWWEYAKKTPFYQELLEEFLDNTMTDTYLEDYIKGLLEQLRVVNGQLNESMNLNQRLLSLLQK
ncbi:MAG: glycosyltransferase family 8 protein [Roseburia sp.]|jgi:lipopolysaccharide biosynthesis glycosyltransferase|nr:glycosyltransferase family 8 protein [Roseburia sp.]